MEDFKKLFEAFLTLKVGVIGDVMLDTYMWGKVDRISPEAPVPVVSLEKKDYRIGGAGNVALNCASLGSQVFILSVTGNDTDGLLLEELFEANRINTVNLVKSNERITTSKTRIISRNQQMMRLDSEITTDLALEDENALLLQIARFIEREDPDVLIFEDYNKGVLTERVIANAVGLCRESGIITTVDPKRKNFFSYRNVDVFKPNLKEVREALNLIFGDADINFLRDVHKQLSGKLGHEVSLITLSDKGIFYEQDDKAAIIPSHLRSIADVSGAGDTVIAVASLVYAVSKNAYLMAEIANIAGGLVCQEVGTVAIDKDKLQHECELLLS